MTSPKICFVTTYIGDLNRLDISQTFQTNDKYDYYLFTNLNKCNIPNKSWKHVKIDINKNFEYYKSNVYISRYFKFMLHEVFKQFKKDYDFVIYCDAFLSPKPECDWVQIVNDCLKSDFPIMQYKHRWCKSVLDELFAIVKCEKETIYNAESLKKYLEIIDPDVNFNEKLFYENTVFGYSLKNEKVINFLNEFWVYYNCKENPSYRDQCLWNFLYLKNKYKAFIVKSMKIKYFDGKIKIRRTIKDYTEEVSLS